MRRTNGSGTRRWLVSGTCGLATAALLAGAVVPAQAANPGRDDIVQVDLGLDGAQPNGWSEASQLTPDGRYALFVSAASNLVPDDVNGTYDAFLRDLRTGGIERVSVADDGSQIGAGEAAISGDGRYVAFSSLVPPGGPGQPDSSGWKISVRDRRAGHTTPLTSGAGDFQRPAISGDGRYVAYTSRQYDIHVTDRWKGTTRLVTAAPDGSRADYPSDDPVISADGTTIGFRSRAENLLPRETADGTPSVRRRTFQFYVWNARTGRIQGAGIDPTGAMRAVLLHARLSPDGRYALFRTGESNGPDSGASHIELYARDLWRGETVRAAQPLPGTRTVSDSYSGTMTADSRWVFFASDADNLVPGDTNQAPDIFRYDVRAGRIKRISMPVGDPGTAWSPHSLTVDGLGTTALYEAVGKVFARRLPAA
ncbi:hypothetical protein [Streptomyces sp. NPDC059063]|uniref:hypothetical protein n=1 Tax=unclassified Streptomyces TaxID=2593676 RepID=UPI003699192E